MMYNQLTPAQIERLCWLSEELSEANQAIMKILRHGYESYNPFDPEHSGNRDDLHRELGDVFKAIELLVESDDLRMEDIEQHKMDKSLRFMHHQN